MATPVVCLPMKLDAFVLNPSACGKWPNSTLAPLAQPNFTWLRLDSQLMEPDVLPYHDLHNASPASANPRVTDLATGQPRTNRQGVYLHWMLPRVYRSGPTQQTAENNSKLQYPSFRAAPDRWLVIRRLHPGFEPSDAMSSGKLRWIEGWIVESNKIRNITEFGFDVDIELECAPFVVGDDGENMDAQAEIFIGAKTPLTEDWVEKRQTSESEYVRLNVAGAANPLFADFTSHNANVFSILDNFKYKDAKDNTKFLTRATASYYVVGWHSKAGEDHLNNLGEKTLTEIFRESALELKDGKDINLNKFPASRAVCHGAMYGVKYQPDVAGIEVPAHKAGQRLGDKSSHPVTVGTTPLDAVLAYIRAHKDSTTDVEDDILHLETLLLRQEDDIDNQQEALDMLTANNFKPSQDNGYRWHFSVAPQGTSGGVATTKKKEETFVPTTKQQDDLATLNAAQAALDVVSRELRQARWELFAKWWNFCADRELVSNAPNGIQTLMGETKDQADLVESLEKKAKHLEAAIQQALKPLVNTVTKESIAERGSRSPFNKQADPTILVPGVENPWPVDWLKSLKVRIATQIKPKTLPGTLPGEWKDLGGVMTTDVRKRLPQDIQGAALDLLTEFFNLHPKDKPEDLWSEQPSGLLPVYYDHDNGTSQPKEGPSPKGSRRDKWNDIQPFFPLLLEFEVRYYHLDKDLWEFGEPAIDPPPGNPRRTRYGLKTAVNGKSNDERVIRGRVLVLPQPGFMLSTNIQRLFNATPLDELPDDLRSEKQQKDLLAQVEKLAYLSSPLTGFADHLITLLNGTHIKPSIRPPGKPLQPLKAAINAGRRAGFNDREIRLMGIETTKTPYADYVSFPDATIDPLKPVTHGQFKFTRLDIIDKFGQAISAIDPAPSTTIPPLYPALSEYFHPQRHPVDPFQANTIGPDPYGHCQFAQFPHTINQDARLNASFVVPPSRTAGTTVASGAKFRPVTEWDNPIWGILVINYAEYALQIFLPDGTFYREVRLGGPSGATETPAWKPFAPPKESSKKSKFPQLDALIGRLKDEAYLRAFIRTVNASLGSVAHTPAQYAQFISAVVGRPLVLANMGFSLELATPPVKSQATNSGFKQPAVSKLLGYEFPVKIGDKDRVYDGLVGYFHTKPDSGELDLDEMLTYYDADDDTNTVEITAGRYPRLKPYHVSAKTESFTGDVVKDAKTAQGMAEKHWREMTVVGALFDPFSKVHLYSGILPIASVQLPQWSLQSAMQRMTAFFHMGPLLVTDVRAMKFDEKKVLGEDYVLADEEGKVAIPAVRSAEWSWLAPFVVRSVVEEKKDTKETGGGKGQKEGGAIEGTGEGPKEAKAVGEEKKEVPVGEKQKRTDDGKDGAKVDKEAGKDAEKVKKVAKKETKWNAFGIKEEDGKPRWEKGPYCAVEGYLQLRRPILGPE
ncbi:hypothetical protein OQA88_5353 [Cercophora sp. LCS_1]